MNGTARSTAVGWIATFALGAAAMVLLAPAAAQAQVLKKRLEELRAKRGAAK